MTAVLTEEDAVLDEDSTYYFISGDYWFVYNDGKLEETEARPANVTKDAKGNVTGATVSEGETIYVNKAPDAPTEAKAYTVSEFFSVTAEAVEVEGVTTFAFNATVTALEDLGSVMVWVIPNA